MTYLIGGDAHNPPQGFSEETAEFLLRPADYHVFCGDFLNLAELGVSAYRFSQTQKDLQYWASNRKIVLVEGNHDPARLLRQIVPQGVEVLPHLDINAYRVIHGHQFGDVVGWLNKFAFFQDIAPSLFAWLASRGIMLSTPREYKDRGAGRRMIYDAALAWLHGQAILYSQRVGKVVIMGHTHSPYQSSFDENTGVIDLGTLPMKEEWLETESA